MKGDWKQEIQEHILNFSLILQKDTSFSEREMKEGINVDRIIITWRGADFNSSLKRVRQPWHFLP